MYNIDRHNTSSLSFHASFIKPETRNGRSSVTKVPTQVRLANVPCVWLPEEEASVVGHPHAQHLVVLTLDNFFGERLLFGTIRGLPQPGGEIINDRIVDAEIILRRL